MRVIESKKARHPRAFSFKIAFDKVDSTSLLYTLLSLLLKELPK